MTEAYYDIGLQQTKFVVSNVRRQSAAMLGYFIIKLIYNFKARFEVAVYTRYTITTESQAF